MCACRGARERPRDAPAAPRSSDSLPLVCLWLLGAVYAIASFPEYSELAVNLLVALLFDLVVIAVAKSICKRPRPNYNVDDMFMTVGPDQHSFPSGHCTRAAHLACLASYVFPAAAYQVLAAWAACIGVSRVVLGRHHVLDVLVGLFVFGPLQAWANRTYAWVPAQLCEEVQAGLREVLF